MGLETIYVHYWWDRLGAGEIVDRSGTGGGTVKSNKVVQVVKKFSEMINSVSVYSEGHNVEYCCCRPPNEDTIESHVD